MTSEQHQAAAQKEEKAAQKAEAVAYTNAPGTNPLNAGIVPELYLYPQGATSQDHLARAQRLRDHVQEHEQAAADLERSEDVECKGLSSSQRSTCPLMGYISEVRDVEGGVRIRFADQSRASAAVPRMRCHYAYARAHGFTNSPDCALYIRGVDIKQTSDPQAIDIVSSDPKTTAEIRKRARAIAADRASQ